MIFMSLFDQRPKENPAPGPGLKPMTAPLMKRNGVRGAVLDPVLL